MPVSYIRVVEKEGDDPIELPSEEDGTLLLSTLIAQFPGACGLKYRNPNSKTMRALRMVDKQLFAPNSDPNGKIVCAWPDYLFVVNLFRKRHHEANDLVKQKQPRLELLTLGTSKQHCSDLIVLGLAWRTTEDDIREYFQKYGELIMAQVKRDSDGKSKGFGFIRFADWSSQERCIQERHFLDGRWCDVKMPHSSKAEDSEDEEVCRKIFVGRITEQLDSNVLHQYFQQYGSVEDIFIPRPFRGFAFVTFYDLETAQLLIRRNEDHVINGVSISVSSAVPKSVTHGRKDGFSGRMSEHGASKIRINDDLNYVDGSSCGHQGETGHFENDAQHNTFSINGSSMYSLPSSALENTLSVADARSHSSHIGISDSMAIETLTLPESVDTYNMRFMSGPNVVSSISNTLQPNVRNPVFGYPSNMVSTTACSKNSTFAGYPSLVNYASNNQGISECNNGYMMNEYSAGRDWANMYYNTAHNYAANAPYGNQHWGPPPPPPPPLQLHTVPQPVPPPPPPPSSSSHSFNVALVPAGVPPPPPPPPPPVVSSSTAAINNVATDPNNSSLTVMYLQQNASNWASLFHTMQPTAASNVSSSLHSI